MTVAVLFTLTYKSSVIVSLFNTSPSERTFGEVWNIPWKEITQTPSASWVAKIKPNLSVKREGLRFETHAGTAIIFLWFFPPVGVVVDAHPIGGVKNVSSSWVYVAWDFDPKVFIKEPAELTFNSSVGFDYWIVLNESSFSSFWVNDITNVPAEVCENVPTELSRPCVSPWVLSGLILVIIDVIRIILPRAKLDTIV